MAKILIVDDSEENRALLEYLLGRRGHTTLLAASGEVALETAAAETPDLILMDLAMPNMDGNATARLIRKQEALASTPMLAMSAVYGNRLGDSGPEPGLFDAFFALPMDPAAWLAEIEAYVKDGAAQPERAEQDG